MSACLTTKQPARLRRSTGRTSHVIHLLATIALTCTTTQNARTFFHFHLGRSFLKVSTLEVGPFLIFPGTFCILVCKLSLIWDLPIPDYPSFESLMPALKFEKLANKSNKYENGAFILHERIKLYKANQSNLIIYCTRVATWYPK